MGGPSHLTSDADGLLGGQRPQPHVACQQVDVHQHVAEAIIAALPQVNQVQLQHGGCRKGGGPPV